MPSGYPQNFEATATSSRMFTLSWDPPNFEDRNGIIIGYVINIINVRTNEASEYTSNTTALTLSSLSPYTIYYCTVAARTSVGTGPFTPVLSLETSPEGIRSNVFSFSFYHIGFTLMQYSFQFHLALPRPHMEML